METCHKHFLLPLLLRLLLHVLVYFSIFSAGNGALAHPRKASNNSVTAILVFGDSTVDPGNNNYVKTIFKGNFPPYGQDFPDQVPTGRFTNGRLTTDFIASYVGAKEYVPPYLDPTLSIEELMTGVSFASAGTGFDPLTPQISNVIEIPKQVEYLKEYRIRLESAIGKQRTENHIKKALFIVSAATNDFVVNYFTLPIRRKTFSVSAYQQFILHKNLQFIQDLINEGARRISVTGLPPMGCLPVVITLFSHDAILERGCIEYFSSIGKQYNQMLQNELSLMQSRLSNLGVKIGISDAYGPLTNMIQGAASPAFDVVNAGCCGTGYLEAGILCNPKSLVCPDTSKYVFWDSIHPTETTYYNVFLATRSTIDSLIRDS
ncbi:GDSL esterase/lipase At5g45960 [Ricinus communis]|uniref:GDSL esterase/lipase At5g45960 n=1 Tax=Ricinus communis TaxID=3988 RepID=UPI00201B03C5|nr:GDSL esterase/lipase At5g45960 [Ricinus communis]XP_048231165.1 GDSL esterase/lipase At5g45960 [Ricinus communis]XP_048231166.1 GDSL esterase/lipase At5g45960 [Ricinus communis]